jgi:adenosylmethionine-8-amino-7-oxononanoate aminotransferase
MVDPVPRFWHPFSQMPAAAGSEIVIARGEGARVWDVDGNEYIDAIASLWYCNIGHGRAEIAEAASEQIKRLAAYHTFGPIANRPAIDLAEKLCAIAPLPDPCAAFLVSGGSDAVDTAGKIARRYWQVRGEPQRTIVVSRSGSYHGMHAYGTSLAGIESNAAGWGIIVPDVRVVDAADVAALDDLLAREGHRIAAFIGEPVIGAGGVLAPEDGYWPAVRDLCRAYDVLLIADEVVTGFGRLGTWFASERYEIEPDLITCAKGLTSGYLPLGAVLAGPAVLEVLWGDAAPPFRHGYTYSGHPAGCAVALANLEVIESEGLIERAVHVGAVLAEVVDELAAHPLVGAVRSVGALAAVELDEALLASRPNSVDEVVDAARDHGVLTRGLVGRSLQLSPPFVITDDELHAVGAGLRAALDAVAVRLESEEPRFVP